MIDRPDGQVELKCAPETESAVYSEGGQSDVWGPTVGLATPTLMLWARHGDFPRGIFEAFAARLLDVRIQDLDAGHLVSMEDPELVVSAALAFALGR